MNKFHQLKALKLTETKYPILIIWLVSMSVGGIIAGTLIVTIGNVLYVCFPHVQLATLRFCTTVYSVFRCSLFADFKYVISCKTNVN